MTHPYKTLRVIRFEKDISQVFLLFVAPALLFAFLVVLFKLISIFVIKIPGPFDFWGFVGFVVLTTFLVLVELYIFFWLAYYLRVRKRVRKELSKNG